MVIGVILAPSYAFFTAFRTLKVFLTLPTSYRPDHRHDIFLPRATRMINIGVLVLIGPFLGAFMSSLILSKLAWRPDFGILASMYGLSLLLVILFGDETLFDARRLRIDQRKES